MAEFGEFIAPAIGRTAFLYEINGQKIGFLQLDATVRETHSRSARITSNEIEDGSTVADNVVLDNETFTIEGLISERPFKSTDIRDVASQVANAGFNVLGNAIGAISGGILPETSSILKRAVALIQLENFYKNKIPFQVVTGLKIYNNVLIRSMEIPVTSKDGKSLRFTVNCEVVKIVSSQNASIPEDKSLAGNVKEQSTGKQAAEAASEAASANNDSILFKWFLK